MSLRNTADEYGTVAKWLHWTIALLFVGAYCAVYYRQLFTEPKTTPNAIAFQIHLSCGMSVLALVVLRIVWRLINEQPRSEPGTRLAHLAAHWGHIALYAIMVLAPLTGYLGTGANVNFFFLFEIPSFKNTALFESLVASRGLTFEEFEKPIDIVHKAILGEWVVWILVVGHALAALYHHVVLKDRTMLKMTTGGSRQSLDRAAPL
jgi:cytochrome b561